MWGEVLVVRVRIGWIVMPLAFPGVVLVKIKVHYDSAVGATVLVCRDDEELV